MSRPLCSNLPLASLLAALAVPLLAGCPKTGPVCNAGQSACDAGCADLTADPANCGACGVSCTSGQFCLAGGCTSGSCACQAGAMTCGAQCVLPQTDPANCGGCASDGGTACATGQVCEAGRCKSACASSASSLCGHSCVDLQTDSNNCGACGKRCPGQSCRGGVCSYDVVVACYTNGEVVGLEATCNQMGPLTAFGPAPYALAAMDGALLSADQMDKQLFEGRLTDFGLAGEAPAIGNAANQVLVAEPFVYVINSQDNTLQVLQRDAGSAVDGGLGLTTVAELSFGANASPEWAAMASNSLYVTLYGGTTAATVDAGQKIVRVDVTQPGTPVLAEAYDLSALPLAPFDGGLALPRPQSALALGGSVYAVLNNLDLNYHVAGPGWLAQLDLTSKSVSLVSLGSACLDPVDLVTDGTNLIVSCFGNPQYDSNFNLLSNDHAGVVMLSGALLAVSSSWNVTAPAATDGGCSIPLPSALALVGNHLYVGDSNCGRIFELDVVGTQLMDGGAPLQACPLDPTLGFSDVASLLTP